VSSSSESLTRVFSLTSSVAEHCWPPTIFSFSFPLCVEVNRKIRKGCSVQMTASEGSFSNGLQKRPKSVGGEITYTAAAIATNTNGTGSRSKTPGACDGVPGEKPLAPL
jgi:hypothetical protein